MKLALNGATIMRSPLEDDARIAAESGFDALEVWAAKLDEYIPHGSLAGFAEGMRGLAVAPWCINSIENSTFRDTAGKKSLLEEVRLRSAQALAIGAPSIVVVPGTRPEGYNRSESIEDAVDALRMMSDAAGEVGLAFEFLGKPGCSVPTLDMAVEIVAEVDRPNVGMVIDTFHFYAGGSRLDDLRGVATDRLFVVHLNGAEDRPKAELIDAHRLYPGQGVIPIDAILRSLHDRGYDGMFSVEIFRPEYWEQDPRSVARNAHGTASAVLAKAGYAVNG